MLQKTWRMAKLKEDVKHKTFSISYRNPMIGAIGAIVFAAVLFSFAALPYDFSACYLKLGLVYMFRSSKCHVHAGYLFFC